jgi:hypothetical protein
LLLQSFAQSVMETNRKTNELEKEITALQKALPVESNSVEKRESATSSTKNNVAPPLNSAKSTTTVANNK